MRDIPTIKVGDRVRVMQTDAMVMFGHANKQFVVKRVVPVEPCKCCLIGNTDDGEAMVVMDHSVMKMGTISELIAENRADLLMPGERTGMRAG